MIRIIPLLIVALLIDCSFAASSFAEWRSPRATATMSIPQHSLTTNEEIDPLPNTTPGIIMNEREGEVGMIRDFILDLQAGRIIYAVGSFERLKSQEDKLFVIPWGVVKADPETPFFTLLRNTSLLENAPSFPPAKWPGLQGWEWIAAVDTYWQQAGGAPRSTISASDMLLRRASDLLGLKIKTETGKELGTVEQLLMDTETGAIAYVILSSPPKSKENQVLFFSLPWSSIVVNPRQHIFLADIDKGETPKVHTPARANTPNLRPDRTSTLRKTSQRRPRQLHQDNN